MVFGAGADGKKRGIGSRGKETGTPETVAAKQQNQTAAVIHTFALPAGASNHQKNRLLVLGAGEGGLERRKDKGKKARFHPQWRQNGPLGAFLPGTGAMMRFERFWHRWICDARAATGLSIQNLRARRRAERKLAVEGFFTPQTIWYRNNTQRKLDPSGGDS